MLCVINLLQRKQERRIQKISGMMRK